MRIKLTYILGFLVLLCNIIIFFLIVRNSRTDIQSHNLILITQLENNTFPIPPLYYFSVYLCSGFSNNIVVLNYTSVVVLGFSVFFKYITTKKYLLKSFITDDKNYLNKNVLLFIFIAISLIFIQPIFLNYPSSRVYLGKLGINVWHNSTVIFVMPFAILLYMESVYFLKSEKINAKNIFLILLLILINVLIKPSFLFCFLPAFILIHLIKEKKIISQKNMYVILIVSIALLLIFLEYYFIYLSNHNQFLYPKDSKSSIIFKPFHIFQVYSKNIPLDMFVSVVFPLFFIILFFKEIKHHLEAQYSTLMFLFAFLIGVLFVESGARMSHGNLTWQIIIANYIFFMVHTTLFLQIILQHKKPYSIKYFLLSGFYLMHFLSGVYYPYKIISTGIYH